MNNIDLASAHKMLREGKHDIAIPILEKEFKNGQVRPYELGRAYLLAFHVSSATKQFDDMIADGVRVKQRGDLIYAMAGICRWIQGKPEEALAIWKDGLKCNYAVNGAFLIPSLLWYASSVQPALYDCEEIKPHLKKLLVERTNWAAPIGRFLLGDIDAPALKLSTQGPKMPAIETNSCLDQASFCIAIDAFRRNDLAQYEHELKNCLELLLESLRPEYFLARYELARLENPVKSRAKRKVTKRPRKSS